MFLFLFLLQSVLQNVYDDSGSSGDDSDSEEEDNASGSDGSEEGEMAWLCPPQTNRLLLFEGSLLHGVVPHIRDPPGQPQTPPGQQDTAAGGGGGGGGGGGAEAAPRVTLMIGWWGPHVCTTDTPKQAAAPGHTTDLKPNMRMPAAAPDSSSGATAGRGRGRKKQSVKEEEEEEEVCVSWPALFKTDDDASMSDLLSETTVQKKQRNKLKDSSMCQPSDALIKINGDIWEEVGKKDTTQQQKGGGGSQKGKVRVLQSDVEFLGNWFLSSRTEILDQIEYSSEACREAAAAAASSSGRSDGAGGSAFGFMSAEDLRRLRGE
jgi:hypothetical protein